MANRNREARRLAKQRRKRIRATAFGVVVVGVLAVAGWLLALQPTALLGYGYLVLYNLVFVLPLVGILLAASARPALHHLAHWNLHHKEWVRLALGGGVVLMGLLILATV